MAGGRAQGGPATPVVFAPGLLCDARLWVGLEPDLAVPSHHVDFREDTTLEAMAARILAAAPPRFVLVGFSLGGMAAILAARRAPERIAGLVVLSTHGLVDDASRQAARLAQIRRVEEGGFYDLAASLPSLYFADPHTRPEAARLVELMALDQGPGVFQRHVRALIDRPDVGAAARGLTTPTTVLSGADDRVSPPELASRLAAVVPGARFLSVEGCGHMTPLECPDLIASVIQTHLMAALEETV